MMRIPFRQSLAGSLAQASNRASRSVRSSLEALEGRQLLSSVPAPSAEIALAGLASPPPTVQASAIQGETGPRVAFVQFEPLVGRVQVSITGDVAGINPSALTNPANYSLAPIQLDQKAPRPDPSRPMAGVVLAPNYVVTGVSLTPTNAPGQVQSLVVIINNNQPLRPGYYLFTIHSSGIVDNVGVALDGAYGGSFPTGNGQPGSDFLAALAVVKNTVQPAIPVVATIPGTPPEPLPTATNGVVPTPIFFPTTQHVQVKIIGIDNRQKRLLGGGNANVQALPGQHFPGKFRLPGTSGASKKSRR